MDRRGTDGKKVSPRRAGLPGQAAAEGDPLLGLQRSIGNRVVADLCSIGQAKLEVAASGDRYEVEADAVAAEVVARLQAPTGPADFDAAPPGVSTPAGPLVHRISRRAEVGAAGGEVSSETEAAINRARSGGRPLDRPTRAAMEGAFGADFGQVRVHAGPGAADLSERVQAHAFTIGSDIFFRSDTPDVSTRPGQALLAHELAHVVQQGAGRQVGRKLQRLAFDATDWSKVTSARISSGGAGGALILDDGNGKLVVKTGEAMASELSVAAKLIDAAGDGGQGWQGSSPDARPIGKDEAGVIHQKVKPLLGNTKREQNALKDLEEGKGVMLFGFAKGTDMQGEIEKTQTKKGRLGGRSLDKSSVVYALTHDPSMMTMFGSVSAADIIMGNGDRFVTYVNFENMLIDMDSKHVDMIDNAQMWGKSFLHSAPEFQQTARDGFDEWTKWGNATKLAAGNFQQIALDMMANLTPKLISSVPTTDTKIVTDALTKKGPEMQAWFAAGLASGLASSVAGLGNIKALASGTPKPKEVAVSLAARRNFLGGMAPDAAWTAAETEAAALFDWKSARPTPKPGWKSARPTVGV